MEIDPISANIKSVFKSVEADISSDSHTLNSNTVLKFVESGLRVLSFNVEHSKQSIDKIKVPVLYGNNGKVQLAFEADAYNKDLGYVIEVEAGRAVTNYQFLKDFFEACMMSNVNYLCIAVRNIYKNSKDFDRVCKFFDALFASRRLEIPLNGVLVIGY